MPQKKSKKIIMKFGGTSVGSPDTIKKVIDIIATSKEPVAGIVVSAFAKVTNQLLVAANLASQRDKRYKKIFLAIANRHRDAVALLVSDETLQQETTLQLQKMLSDLESVLKGVYLLKEVSTKILDLILSYGERLSAYCITQGFRDKNIQAEFVDARKLVKTDSTFGSARVNFEQTYKNITKYFHKSKSSLKVITGFIASTENKETTTLGRGGSDYTASLFGAAIGASKIEIWTDVDGVMTADPRKVKAAFTISHMTYQEAMEMSHFGAKVIYPPTMTPALKNNIPLIIRNTFNPQFPGTVVSDKTTDTYLIKGISSIEDVAVILVQGSGMLGIPGIVARLFSSLAKNTISVILITQGSSEHTICFAIEPTYTQKAKAAIEEEFRYDMQDGLIDPLVIKEHLSIIAVVGEHMRNTIGIAGKLFTTLGDAKINIIEIAQGSSERNISFVIANNDETKALNAIHKTFFENTKL